MCSECGRNPCVGGCPNAPEPPVALNCGKCGANIYADEEYAVIKGKVYCEECIDDMPYCVLIPLLGGEWLKAEVPEE